VPPVPFGLYLVPTVAANNVNDGKWHLFEMPREPAEQRLLLGPLRVMGH
jgi:hypothetical protein